jgi:hypothetical protein
MMKITKTEHHSVNWHYNYELDADKLQEIYPDSSDEEIAQLMKDLGEGNANIDDVISDAWDNDVEIEWEFDYDDVWTDRKGGYDITYDIEME